MMFWASFAQFASLVVLAPLDAVPPLGDATSLAAFLQNLSTAWGLVCDGTAGVSLFSCIATMFLSQLMQALVVKHSSAAYTVLCMALVMPTCAFAFTLPLLMGDHVEQLLGTAPLALGLVFLGVMLYRVGETLTKDPPKEDACITPIIT